MIDLVNDSFALNDINNAEEISGSIKGITEGGRHVDFGMDSYSQTRFNSLLQRKLLDNEKLINRYRLMYKVVKPNAEN